MDNEEYKMTPNEWLNFNLQKKKDKIYEDNRYYCYCGHSVVIMPKSQRTFCRHCGHWVYKDKRKQNANIKKIQLEEAEKLEQKKKDYFKERIRGYIDGNKGTNK